MAVSYENCAGGGSTTFELVIECDSTQTPITLTNVSPTSERLMLDLVSSETVVSSFFYSHAVCGAPTFSSFTSNGQSIDFVTFSFENDIVTLTAAPEANYALVGSYAVQVEISSPVVTTLADIFLFEVSDPCENVIYTAQISPEFEKYQIGTNEGFKLTFEDNLSALFGTTEVCGPLQLDYIECVGCETVVTITDLNDVSGV